MLFRVDEEGVEEVSSTKASGEGFLETNIEDWIEQRSDILGEHLLIIGRQVPLDEGRDRIDLIALDRAGNLVVIELKRDLIGGGADLQALRYAALISGWSYEEVQKQAEGYWRSTSEERGTFAQEVEAFCDEGYEINGQQRIILAGRDVKPRLGTMALWLLAQGIDIHVVSIDLFKDQERVYLQPQVVIPPPAEERFRKPVTAASSDKPWLKDGEAWHLEQRASAQGRAIIESVVELIAESVPDADGPHWGQKFYISWKDGNRIWASLHTGSPNVEYLHLRGSTWSAEEAAELLGWEVVQPEDELAEKLSKGSSVQLRQEGELRFTMKDVRDLQGEARDVLARLLRKSWLVFSGEQVVGVSGDGEQSGLAAKGDSDQEEIALHPGNERAVVDEGS